MKVKMLTDMNVPHERRIYKRGEILNTLLGRAKDLCEGGVAEPAEPWPQSCVFGEDGKADTAPSSKNLHNKTRREELF